MTLAVSDIVAVIALLVSVYAVWVTSRFNKRQLSLIDTQEQLNKRLLEQGESDAIAARKADVGATLVNMGSSRYRLRVFNKGKTVARRVTIELPDDAPVPRSELESKLPMEVLESHGSVDLIAAIHRQTPLKQRAILRWADEHSDANEKTVYLTL